MTCLLSYLVRRTACLVAVLTGVSNLTAAPIIGELTDQEQLEQQAYVDILSAWIEQDSGGLLKFVIETRGPIPTTLAQPEDHLTFLWVVDADNDANTGQPHGQTGSEFNVRAVISELYGGGFVDVTGAMQGGGTGTVVVQGNRVEITISLTQIANPPSFHWQADSCHAVDNMCVSANYETAATDATTLTYTPPASVSVTTPLLMLSMAGPTTSMLEVLIRDAAGNILPNADHVLTFHSTNEASATVDAAGMVTAQSVPVQHWEVPYIEVWADGVMADNSAVIRVTGTDLGVVHQTCSGTHVAYYLPRIIEGVDLEAIAAQYQLIQATDRAYAAQWAGVGDSFVGGGLMYLVLDVADDPNTVPCGASGNPIRLGWQFGKPAHNSCFIVNDPQNRTPQWFVIFHEMGHNFTTSCNSFNQFLWTSSPDHNFAYSEGMASLAAMWSWQDIMACPGGLGQVALDDLDRHFGGYLSEWRQSVADYRTAGANYANLDANIVDGILLDMLDLYGPKAWFDLFSTFQPTPEPLPFPIDTREKQAAWFVAAFSASAGTDLRETFRANYGFPIKDEDWIEIWPVVQARVAARTWQAHAAPDLDCDGDTDVEDLGLFIGCTSGPAIPQTDPSCAKARLDSDEDVDQNDFALFQRCYSGALPADPNCLN